MIFNILETIWEQFLLQKFPREPTLLSSSPDWKRKEVSIMYILLAFSAALTYTQQMLPVHLS